ncbi:11-oxo-beta-amyrin 30-oxidase [Lachnellula willkommii]|uniref:11-oxo-beta-amyrin 30-oxidase n=1 Tax=Lachnellula willkommii TaxID=215461 RepID=A0A559MAM2_9HELO|nr:11-oxo-beta-amyrin 30-oxidase [Lachnellula willkommii]
MLLSVLILFVSLCGAWTSYSWYCLLLNYLRARKISIPLRVIPISHENLLWMVVDKKIFIPLFERLPSGTGNFTRFNWRGWEFTDKYRSHFEMGDLFMLVTPGRNWLYVCSPDILLDVFQRKSDFPRPLELFEMVNVFGPNLSTTDGPTWQKHRKITASCFNEQNNEIVWSESVVQARDMLRYWSTNSPVNSTADDTRTLSLNVLSSAGFGKSYKFQGHNEESLGNVATSYKESLQTILDNCILLMVLGTRLLSFEYLPNALSATVTFKQYMTEVYENEKRAIAKGKSTGRNLMTSLIRASQENGEPGQQDGGLTESEIYGNIFVFNFAGHDTTAHTLAFAVVLLAASPSVQDWISQELHCVLGDRPTEDWNYVHDFPKLKRCQAVLMETLRLYTPVPIAKSMGKEARQLRIRDRDIMLPENTTAHPKYWGQDSLEWRPSRWINTADSDESLKNETITTPQKGSFVAWSEGVRICPGKKFSQVEFVASIAGLFRDWRVEPLLQKGEDLRMASKRVMELVEKDTGQVLLLQMLHPERAPLTWRKR